MEQVGTPCIAYFDESFEAPASNTAFIQIPHLHPGREKYGKQPESFRRVLLLTWMVTATVCQYMLEALAAIKKNAKERREAICLAVIERFNTEAASLVETLKSAKSTLEADWQLPIYQQRVLSPESGS
jgi:hypothetical protein